MKDYAREENGGSIVMASCVDERFLPESMLDGKDGSFWLTTGMFPQEFVLALEAPIRISKITMLSLNVKKLAVEKCESEKPDTFDKVFEVELANRGDRLQTEVHQVNIKAKFLKFTLVSGHAEFATVNRVSVVGESANGGGGSALDADDEDSVGTTYGGQSATPSSSSAAQAGRTSSIAAQRAAAAAAAAAAGQTSGANYGGFGMVAEVESDRGGSASMGFAGSRPTSEGLNSRQRQQQPSQPQQQEQQESFAAGADEGDFGGSGDGDRAEFGLDEEGDDDLPGMGGMGGNGMSGDHDPDF